ncbi:SsrA-binding protein [Muriicola sp. E247]|uniref:SsrA-binding protein n=1 Tax=Muriicola sp. E247 TaxID=3242730 RepID=UPI0035258BD7
MKKIFFKVLAYINRMILPSFSRKAIDLSKASKLQLAIIGWRYYITTRALD